MYTGAVLTPRGCLKTGNFMIFDEFSWFRGFKNWKFHDFDDFSWFRGFTVITRVYPGFAVFTRGYPVVAHCSGTGHCRTHCSGTGHCKTHCRTHCSATVHTRRCTTAVPLPHDVAPPPITPGTRTTPLPRVTGACLTRVSQWRVHQAPFGTNTSSRCDVH